MKRMLAIVALCGASAFGADVSEVKIRAIDGFGGDLSSVISRCQTKAGQPYDPLTARRDVTALKDSKEFEEISVDAKRAEDGVEVTFYVKRKMRYQAPAIVKGASYFGASKVIKESGIRDGSLYGEAELAEAAGKVRLAYQKKHFIDAKVTPIAEVLEGGNNCTLTFNVVEGERQKIRNYVFEGALGEVDEAELHKAINDLPWWNPVGWFSEQPVTGDQLAQGCELVAEVYRNHGYLDAVVKGPRRLPVEGGEIDVCYEVEPGVRYRVGSTSIRGLTKYSEADVRAKSALPEPGAVAGAKDLADAAHRVEVTVGSGDMGLADSHVDVRRLPSEGDPSALDLVFVVTEGVPVVINEVKVIGNDYTKDKVIRRAIPLGPGDRMLADRAERGKKRLENLDYFSRVSYSLKDAGKGKDDNGAEYRDLVYEVEEKNTGTFMVGVGASSVDSVFVQAEVQQPNFDLFAPRKLFRGAGQKGRLYIAAGPRIQTYEASVTEPHLFDRFLEFTVEGYRRQRWYDDYDIIRTGAAGSLSYPVKFWRTWDPFGRLGFRLSGEFVQFDDVERGMWLYGRREVSLREEDRRYGDAVEPVLRLFWSRDTCDTPRMPTSGMRTRLFADLAPGGDNKFWRLGVMQRNYFNVVKRYNHILMLNFRAETIDGLSDDVPIYNRMFLGGPKSIRGIEYRNVSPMACKLKDDDPTGHWTPWGGQTLFCLNAEYTVPIVRMLRVAVFSDLGCVGEDAFDIDFSDTFAWTAGLGLRLDLPMFPIRLDFAAPIKKPDHADKEVFSFTVGYDF